MKLAIPHPQACWEVWPNMTDWKWSIPKKTSCHRNACFILCVWPGHQHYHDSQSVRTKFKLHNLSCVWVQNKLVSWCYMTSVDCKPGKTGTLGFNTGLSLNWQAAHNTSLTWFFLSCQDKVAGITMIPGCLTWTKKNKLCVTCVRQDQFFFKHQNSWVGKICFP